jgi:hypothetical protein
LKQLNNFFPTACYIDCCTKSDPISTLTSNYSQGCTVFLIDEVSQLSNLDICHLINFCKDTKGVFFVLTGSVPFVVDDIVQQIGDGFDIMLPPIMYAEYLSWKKNAPASLTISTPVDFRDYLCMTNLAADESRLNYVQDIVNMTLKSYNATNFVTIKNTLNDWFKSKPIYELKSLLAYVTECTVLNLKPNSNEFNNPTNKLPISTHKAKEFKQNDINTFCLALENAGLIRKTTLYSDKHPTNLYLFEYPQFVKGYIKHGGKYSDYDAWVEEFILLKLYYYYFGYVGKYRTTDSTFEIGCVYNFNSDWGAIEVKNRPVTSVLSQVQRYLNTSIVINNQSICEYTFTCTDHPYTRMSNIPIVRNDLLALILELAYVDRVSSHMIDCQSLHSLLDKYFID